MHYKNKLGFSLIELLITMALLAAFITIATPSYFSLIENIRIISLNEKLLANLNYARTSSVLKNKTVEICGSSDGYQCDGQWSRGWVSRFIESDSVISQEKVNTQEQLRWDGISNSIRFHGNGTSPLGNGRFYICRRNGEVARQIVINRQGRNRLVIGLESKQNQATGCGS